MRELIEIVRPLVPESAPLMPGTDFGPMVGKGRGMFGDFAFSWKFYPYLRRNVYEELISAGVRLPEAASTEITFVGKHEPPDLVEPQLLPGVNVHPDCMPKKKAPVCSGCGRVSRILPEVLYFDSRSLTDTVDIFQAAETLTVLVTERFRTACLDLNLTNVSFRPVDVR